MRRYLPEMKMFASLIVQTMAMSGADVDGYATLHSRHLKRLLTHRNYSKIIRTLMDSGNVERRNYLAGSHSYRYRLHRRFSFDHVVKETIGSPRLIRVLKQWNAQRSSREQARWQPIHHELARGHSLIQIDREAASDELSRVRNGSSVLSQSAIIESIASNQHLFSVGEASQRVTTSAGLLKRTIREKSIHVDGQCLSEVDLRSSQKTISQQLRERILDAEITRYKLSKSSGVSEASLSRFVKEENSLTLASIDAIGDVLGLQVVVRPPKRKVK
jgi:Cro/C1-type HTH DNA-binding domain